MIVEYTKGRQTKYFEGTAIAFKPSKVYRIALFINANDESADNKHGIAARMSTEEAQTLIEQLTKAIQDLKNSST